VSTFVDTSAFYALLVRTERSHDPIRASFAKLIADLTPLWTTSFVVVETMALLQHRVGLAAAHDFDEALLPSVRVRWVDEDLYRSGVDRLWRANRRRLSLVDAVSLEFMRSEGIGTALALDPHFREAGITLLP
jgi:predicted nucleic acid-binding protein